MPTVLADLSWGSFLLLSFAFFGSLTLIGLVSGYAAERAAFARGRKVFDVPRPANLLRREIIGTVLFHVVFVPFFTAAMCSGTLHFMPTITADFVTFFGSWIGFQIFYYGFHRAMHHRRLFWMHRWHHESKVTSPMTGLSMSPIEALGWVFGLLFPAYLCSSVGLLGFGGFAAFLAIHFIGNVAGHANADFFPMQATRASSWWSNPVSYHSLHHARFDGHYGFAAAYMDRAFHSEFEDWKAVHDRVWDGAPLTHLRQRVDLPSPKH